MTERASCESSGPGRDSILVTAPTSPMQRRGVRLEALTIGWNSVEAIVAVTGGLVASSVALVSFGLDSVIEVGAAIVVLWQFLGIAEEREQRALKLIGGSFFALAAYVLYSSLSDLVRQAKPDVSTVGIVLTAVSLVVMPALASLKKRTANSLGSRTLLADSKQSSLSAYLSLYARRTRVERRVPLVVGGPGRSLVRSVRSVRSIRRSARRPRSLGRRHRLLLVMVTVAHLHCCRQALVAVGSARFALQL